MQISRMFPTMLTLGVWAGLALTWQPAMAQRVEPGVAFSSRSIPMFKASTTPASSPTVSSTAHLDVSQAGNEPWMLQLDTLLQSGDFAKARVLLFTPGISPIAASERLKPWAQAGNTPAMWLLAERLWYGQRFNESANWVYAADLGTRMDASVCMDNSAIGIEQSIVHAFSDTVQAARRNPVVMRDAIVFALDFQQHQVHHANNPKWACSMIEQPRDSHLPITVSESEWARRRQYQLDTFRSQSTR